MADDNVQRIPVAIAGGGPVGLMLSLFLDFHGVRSVIFNTEPEVRRHPKGSTHNSRTMEHHRRLGIAQQIRGAQPAARTADGRQLLHAPHRLGARHASACRRRRRSCATSPGRRLPTRCRSRSCAPTRCTSRRSCSSAHARAATSRSRFGMDASRDSRKTTVVSTVEAEGARRQGDLARAISDRLRRRPQLRAPLAGAALSRLRQARSGRTTAAA